MPESRLPRARRILTGIDSSTWEHPADRAALMALRRVPAFDTVLKKVFGLFGEKPIRLAFQSNAVRASETQFPWIWERYVEVCETLDAPRFELFVSQTPLVNAGAYGMEKPFIVLNSGALRLLDKEELTWLLGHELGHIMSGHVLYRTMTVLLLQLAQMGFPVVGLAARAVLVALLEWNRKAELSSDRAGLLAVQNPEAALKAFMKLAGGGHEEETNLNEFLVQAEEYRTSGDAADLVFKVLNLLGTTHPFHVLRAAEIRDWIEAGEYDRVLRGEYRRRGEAYEPWREDLAEAARSYREDAQDLARQFGEALRSAREKIAETFRAAP
ncbi:MAG: M48 family metallopeptidase [Candidatus Cloacimonetes bacterium]|jgi:Zn-dependent protease with chaperone function|nr:M48 family metallopeptidase [Candidatus Cloacimonadota bacterium]